MEKETQTSFLFDLDSLWFSLGLKKKDILLYFIQIYSRSKICNGILLICSSKFMSYII